MLTNTEFTVCSNAVNFNHWRIKCNQNSKNTSDEKRFLKLFHFMEQSFVTIVRRDYL